MDMNVLRRLEQLNGYVQDSGESRWVVANAIEKEAPVPTLATALFTCFRSRQSEPFPEKMLAALRKGFEGHSVHR
jgi:6-phosphogluconate dehydrogenase